jgi:hypothetical protein
LAAWAWPVAIAACVITAILVVGHVVRSCTPAGIAKAIRPEFKSTYITTMNSCTTKLNAQAKLVVLQAEVEVNIVKTDEKIFEIGGLPIPLGTTTVHLRCHGNKVQYYVPLDKVGAHDFSYHPDNHQLVLRVPLPVLDESIVEVQSDPTKIELRTEVGWARLDSRSGKALRELAMRELRSAVIHEGRQDFHAAVAKMHAEKKLLQFLSPLAAQLREGVTNAIEFH